MYFNKTPALITQLYQRLTGSNPSTEVSSALENFNNYPTPTDAVQALQKALKGDLNLQVVDFEDDNGAALDIKVSFVIAGSDFGLVLDWHDQPKNDELDLPQERFWFGDIAMHNRHATGFDFDDDELVFEFRKNDECLPELSYMDLAKYSVTHVPLSVLKQVFQQIGPAFNFVGRDASYLKLVASAIEYLLPSE